jgi:hypothetical protein
MSFRVQHPETNLFWTTDPSNNRILLGPEGSLYKKDDDSHIINVDTGLYIRHCNFVLWEALLTPANYDFEWTIEPTGEIFINFDGGYYIHPNNGSVEISRDAFLWNIVPVSRASALLAEALNA